MNLEKEIKIFDKFSGNSETTSRQRLGFYSLTTKISSWNLEEAQTKESWKTEE